VTGWDQETSPKDTLPADQRTKEPGEIPALGLDIFQFFHFLDQPCGHALVGFENLRVFILLCKP
jgi:hypothetical protein